MEEGSYRSAHVLLNLLNELGKSDKMRGLPNILLPLRNKFNEFNNSGARLLDFIYHLALLLIKYSDFGVKTSIFCHRFRNVTMYRGRHNLFPEHLHGVISLRDATHAM